MGVLNGGLYTVVTVTPLELELELQRLEMRWLSLILMPLRLLADRIGSSQGNSLYSAAHVVLTLVREA